MGYLPSISTHLVNLEMYETLPGVSQNLMEQKCHRSLRLTFTAISLSYLGKVVEIHHSYVNLRPRVSCLSLRR